MATPKKLFGYNHMLSADESRVKRNRIHFTVVPYEGDPKDFRTYFIAEQERLAAKSRADAAARRQAAIAAYNNAGGHHTDVNTHTVIRARKAAASSAIRALYETPKLNIFQRITAACRKWAAKVWQDAFPT